MAASAMAASGMCFHCGEPVEPTDSFCESCGAELAPLFVSDGRSGSPRACEICPSARISADGYCESCGLKVPSGRDHQEIDLAMVAGVTHRGLRHSRNEDAMALATADLEGGPAVVAAVCDGVSTAAHSDQASLAAVRAAAGVLLAAVRSGGDPFRASRAAVDAAVDAVVKLAGPTGDVPASTFVSAVLLSGAITVCWLGDSRVYWLDDDPASAAELLTRDDSLSEEMVADGFLPEADALASAQSHVLTRWIGADFSDPVPHIVRFEPPGSGMVLLCSDGLWNYRPEPAKLAELALPAATTGPLGAARALVDFALEAGGMDNVTAVLAPFPPLRLPLMDSSAGAVSPELRRMHR
jgi:serine/threonine protein phosphatase PrpC